MLRLLVVLAAAALLTGCVSHIEPYRAKHRRLEMRPVVSDPIADAPPSEGSLFSQRSWFTQVVRDQRAQFPGDILTVRVIENATAQRDAGTDLSKESTNEAAISALFGLMKQYAEANPTLDPAALLSSGFTKEFASAGSTARRDSLQATVPVRVIERLSNGDFFVEGARVILVNNEEHHLYVSGVVRPVDISSDNSITSDRIADAEIEFTGRGALSRNNEQSWFDKLFSWVF